MADLSTTQTMADGLSKQGLVYLCALSWTVAAVLFLWLMRVTKLRIDDRDAFQHKLEALTERISLHLDRNTEATTMLLADAQARGKRRRAADSPPVLGEEPVSQVRKVGP